MARLVLVLTFLVLLTGLYLGLWVQRPPQVTSMSRLAVATLLLGAVVTFLVVLRVLRVVGW